MFHLSIDIEASGPFPGLFSLVSVGAIPIVEVDGAFVPEQQRTFYVELKPLEGAGFLPAAMAIHGLSAEYLAREGVEPARAMELFAAYVADLERDFGGVKAAAWPASFDCPFVGWYAQRFLETNPIGHSSLDIPSFGMGLFRCSRRELSARMKKAGFRKPKNPKPHNALADAVEQGATLAFLLNHAFGKAEPSPKPSA